MILGTKERCVDYVRYTFSRMARAFRDEKLPLSLHKYAREIENDEVKDEGEVPRYFYEFPHILTSLRQGGYAISSHTAEMVLRCETAYDIVASDLLILKRLGLENEK